MHTELINILKTVTDCPKNKNLYFGATQQTISKNTINYRHF